VLRFPDIRQRQQTINTTPRSTEDVGAIPAEFLLNYSGNLPTKLEQSLQQSTESPPHLPVSHFGNLCCSERLDAAILLLAGFHDSISITLTRLMLFTYVLILDD